eukprot:scaffold4439_cov124-Pinguiococcus_pyrenoidosus.AAC.1
MQTRSRLSATPLPSRQSFFNFQPRECPLRWRVLSIEPLHRQSLGLRGHRFIQERLQATAVPILLVVATVRKIEASGDLANTLPQNLTALPKRVMQEALAIEVQDIKGLDDHLHLDIFLLRAPLLLPGGQDMEGQEAAVFPIIRHELAVDDDRARGCCGGGADGAAQLR